MISKQPLPDRSARFQQRWRLWSIWLQCLVFSAPLSAAADGQTWGKSGSEEQQALRTAYAETDTLELVVKLPSSPVEQTRLVLFLSDFDTNRPIAGADLHVVAAGEARFDVVARPGPNPGTYEAIAPFPKTGIYPVDVIVTQGVGTPGAAPSREVLKIQGLEVGGETEASPAIASGAEDSPRIWILLGLAGVALYGAGLITVRLRRRQRVGSEVGHGVP